MFTGSPGQIPFIDGGDNFYRWVISNATDYGGWTATTSPMMTMSTLIGAYWNWISFQALMPTAKLKQPQLSLAFVDKGPVLQPLVQVQCSAHPSNGTQTKLRFPNSQLNNGQMNAYTNVTWPVPSNYSEVDLLSYGTSGNLYMARPPLEDFESAPSALFIFAVPDQNLTKTVIPCSVLVHWVPSQLSVYPKTDRNIHDTYSNPIDIFNSSSVKLSQLKQLAITEDWWGMLNDYGTPISSILQAPSLGAPEGCLKPYICGQGLAYCFSTMLGVFLTDALARYVPANTSNVVYQESHNGSKPYAQNLGFFYQEHTPVPNHFWSWLAYAERYPNAWREVTMTVRRYGYAWSFSGVLSMFAGIALLTHMLLALAHVAVVLHGRWSSSAWDSIGNMLALALRSRSPAVPPDHWKGGEKKETWAATVSVRVVEDELELMFNPMRAETLRLIQR